MTTKKRSKRTWRWVARDRIESPYSKRVNVYLSAEEPKQIHSFYTESHFDGDFDMRHVEFKRVFGVSIPYGKCVKVEFSARVIDEEAK